MRWRPHFRAVPGQYLTLRSRIDGREVRRAYSICSGSEDGELRVAIKRVEGGLFSNHACETFAPGHPIDVMPPHGGFTAAAELFPGAHLVGCAAGSGVTPILSILKSVLAKTPDSRFTLFYGNRSKADCLFYEELARLSSQYASRLTVVHVFSREDAVAPALSGRVDERLPDLIKAHVPDPSSVAQWFVCGPEAMMAAAQRSIMAAGALPERVVIERFGAGADEPAPEGVALDAVVTVQLLGQRVELRPGSATIASAAAQAGVNLPVSCGTGVCAMCKAKVIEGQASMPADTILPQEEIEAGFILTCRSHALSRELLIDCDVD